MTKEQAAEYLGISPRSVIRYAQRGLLKVRYAGQERGGKVAIYDPDSVEGLKVELEAQRAQPRTPPKSEGSETGLSVRGRAELAPVLENFKAGFVEAIAEALTAPRLVRLTDLSAKLTLSLTEATRLSGLSESFLRRAIQAGELRGVRGRSRGWSIKATDLRAFVEGL